MNRETELLSQYNVFKPSPPRPPADGQEQLSLVSERTRVLNEQFQKRDFCDMSHLGKTSHTPENENKCNNAETSCSSSPAPSDRATPPCFRWAQNLLNLLEDLDGTELFKQYLEQEVHDTRSLDFWFACEGLKKGEKSTEYLRNLIKVINRNYVSGLPDIRPETKRIIANKIVSQTQMDKTIFNDAQKEVEVVMTKTTYPNFLRSDLYVQHVQRMQENMLCRTPENETVKTDSGEALHSPHNLDSPSECSVKKNSEPSVATAGSREKLDVLPTVFEDSELEFTMWHRNVNKKTVSHKNRLANISGKVKPEEQAGHYLKATTPGYNTTYMKYAAYLPPSAQDSELQSASSDAQTDDTMSIADSVESYAVFHKACQKKLNKHKALKCSGPLNNDHLPRIGFIPRTERLPQQAITKLDPAQFAALLTSKLNKLQDEIKIKQELEKLRKDSSCPTSENQVSSADVCGAVKSSSSSLFHPQKIVDTPQSILDEHICRVFHDSAHQTPSPSPGCLTPPVSQRLEDVSGGRRVPPCGSSSNQISSAANCFPSSYQPSHYKVGLNSPYYLHHEGSRHRRDRDSYSTDSGVQDFASDFEQPCSQMPNQSNLPRNSLSSAAAENNMGVSRRSYGRKLLASDSGSSCVDSGISLIDLVSCSTTREEKVTTWLEMKKYSSMHGSDSEKDLPVCHKKYSPSLSPVMGQSSKRPMSYNSSRSGSLGSGNSPWPFIPSGAACSSMVDNAYYSRHGYGMQPISQEPNMSVLMVPDPEMQMLEVKRRLEDDSRFKQQMKPKFALSGREKMSYEGARSKTFTKPFEFQDDGTLHRKSNRRSYPNSVQNAGKASANYSNSNDVTTVAYSFGRGSVPYLSKLPGKNINLKQFKSLVSKKGNFRYFFKTGKDFGVVYEEITDDMQVLPLWEGKIFSIIEQIE